ncbi:DNA-binding response regulator [Porphyromonas sp. HMSC077F02]|uniref:LytR/AlgR family response regulator transcription factor n=1 Tax=Porphyromonas TaxID=836 RepID=UPI0008A65F35|nr:MULTISPECIES: LytTR family DNA-binding domain-containing protein [Porphyromonas]MDD7557620.1 LytTR family DNA-binding domain-containing protein [Porphyromonas somerae]MDY3119361.1 LytTR family DNA-binding domain-containing protein [Porphyromonas somerae]MDY3884882.1 LytTR family DNA-binding domain-containing protein [Porphyromonas somerae]MDY5816298.1 LytTR family DNA-binding domain-containing protein [Porphyromonas somerae]OFO55243.1 DNA-binding response regulator [Porphyromonas sp. HMSC07
MKVIIVEDEYFTAKRLESLLKEGDREVEVLAILQSVEECEEWWQSNDEPDLAFMDIHLADGEVFSLFERVEVTCPIIFTTAYEEYALKAFEVNSIDYLLKPIKASDLERALGKVERFSRGGEKVDNQAVVSQLMAALGSSPMSYKSHFLAPFRDKLLPISVDKIAYIRSENKACVVVTTDKKEYAMDLSLEKMGEELNPKLFFRANRQYIVAHSAIVSMSVWFGGKLTVSLSVPTPEAIIVSKAKNREFREWYQGML